MQSIQEFEKKIKKEFKFLDFAPVVFVSALTKEKIENLFRAINDSYEGATTRISTSVLNEVLLEIVLRTPPVEFNGGILKVLYANQVATAPPQFVLFVNDAELMHYSYKE